MVAPGADGNVGYNTGSMRTMAENICDSAKAYIQRLEDLSEDVKSLQSVWTDEHYTNFYNQYDQKVTRLRELEDDLRKAASSLEGHAEAADTTTANIENTISEIGD